MTTLIKNSVIHLAKILKVYTALALVGAGVVVVAQLSASLTFDFHQIALSLLIFFSVLSLILAVSKPAAREFEAIAIRWIRAVKRVRAEGKAPAKIKQRSERRQH
jgi:hypothetical protein